MDSQWLARLRDRLDRLFLAQGQDSAAAALREAVREADSVLAALRHAAEETEAALAGERRQLEDAERRGRLAVALPDPETAAVAARFVERHRVRITILERKLGVQQDELHLSERELEELAAHAAELGRRDVAADLRSAARTGEHAAQRPGGNLDDDLKRMQTERRMMDEAVERQLAYLKKKMGKDSI